MQGQTHQLHTGWSHINGIKSMEKQWFVMIVAESQSGFAALLACVIEPRGNLHYQGFSFLLCPLWALWVKTLTWEIRYGAMAGEILPIFCPVNFWNVGTDNPIAGN